MATLADFEWFEVRQVRARDIPMVVKLDSTSFVSNFTVDSVLDRAVNFADRFLVAKEYFSEVAIGYIIGSTDRMYTEGYAGYVYISRFAVKNKYRQHGIGTSLLMTLENLLLRTREYRGMIADVRRSNTKAINLYQKMGFTQSETHSKPDGYNEGKTEDDRFKVVMYKKFPLCRP